MGKTLLGLHYAFSAAADGRPAILATFQENSTQLARIASGFGWSFDDPCISVLSRSPVDLYIDEWVYDLLDLVDETEATRVVVDSLGDLLLASPDQVRFRELLHSLEFVQFHPTAVAGVRGREGFLVSEAVRGEGATLHDADGERFVDELAPRDEVARAIRAVMDATGEPQSTSTCATSTRAASPTSSARCARPASTRRASSSLSPPPRTT